MVERSPLDVNVVAVREWDGVTTMWYLRNSQRDDVLESELEHAERLIRRLGGGRFA